MTPERPDLSAIFEAALDPVATIDAEGRIHAFNAAAERTFGYTRDEVEGKGLVLLLAEEVRERYGPGLDLPGRVEVDALRKDGGRVPVDLAIAPIGGDQPLFAAFMRDISEQRRTEARLRSEQERLKEAQRLAHIGSWEWEMDSDETVWSDEHYRIFGADPATHEASYDGFLAYVHPDDRAVLVSYIQEALSDPGHYEHEYRIVRPDGEVRHIYSRGEAIRGADGQTVGLRGTTQDVTERKRAEELEAELQQAHRLESVGLLAGGVAHDFNNLLAVILNYATFVLEELDETSEIRSDIEEIRKAAERAADLTRQLLLFSRREVAEPVVVEVNELVNETESLLRTTLGEDVVLRTKLADGLAAVEIGSGQLEQVLLNLAFNARDAMPHGGQVTIETAALDEGVRLVVRDTGSGMWPRVAEQAFTPFFTTKARGEGTGLGLATVYGIVRESGGTVRIDSEPGGGTAVTIDLPVAAADRAREPAPQAPAPEPAPGGVVLVAEDEEAVRRLAVRILADRDYRVLEAADGDQAWQRFQEHAGDIDVLVTDVVMPGMPARELVEEARSVRPDLGAIYMSGYTGDALSRRGIAADDAVMIRKPFDADTLLAAVAAAGEGAHQKDAAR